MVARHRLDCPKIRWSISPAAMFASEPAREVFMDQPPPDQ